MRNLPSACEPPPVLPWPCDEDEPDDDPDDDDESEATEPAEPDDSPLIDLVSPLVSPLNDAPSECPMLEFRKKNLSKTR